MKTSTSIAAILAIAGAIGLAWWVQRPAPERAIVGGGSQAETPRQPAALAGGAVAVESALVRPQPVRDEVEAVGSLRSRQGTVVRAEVSGRITEIGFRDGQRVARGQWLVQLDDRLQRAQLEQALAELSIAQANHKRNSELVAEGFISQRGLDESAAAVKVAQAKTELARTNVSRLRVLAPFDGVTGLRNISVGDYLKEGADIVNLEDMNAMYVDFRLPERWQARVRPGQGARVQVEALPDLAFAAVVQAVDPLIDANGRSLNVRGCIDNRLLQLRPGMFARVVARLGNDRQALMIPEQAIVSQGGRQSVIRLIKSEGVEGSPAWRSERVDVETGTRIAGRVEIVRGLAAGERVVTAGQQRIQGDGTPLRVSEGVDDAPAAAPSAAAPAARATGLDALPLAKSAPGANPCGVPARR